MLTDPTFDAPGKYPTPTITHEKIALAVSVTTRCDGCIASHAKAVREAELTDALGIAIALNAGTAYVYFICVMARGLDPPLPPGVALQALDDLPRASRKDGGRLPAVRHQAADATNHPERLAARADFGALLRMRWRCASHGVRDRGARADGGAESGGEPRARGGVGCRSRLLQCCPIQGAPSDLAPPSRMARPRPAYRCSVGFGEGAADA